MKTITLQDFKNLQAQLNKKVEINRGDIWMVDIPEKAREVLGKNIQIGIRPCIIISGEGNNKHANIVNILPISSKTNKVYPQHTLIEELEDINACGLKEKSIVLGEQYITIDKAKLLDKIGKAPKHLIKQIDQKQQIQQGLNARANFNWKEAFKKVRMMLKSKNKDKEIYNYLHQQLQDNCNQYNVDISIVLDKYAEYYTDNKKINIYINKHDISKNIKNINFASDYKCLNA
ncbi:type II toxin-antitoxin system PemK/MazF family toxin [Clostridium botulinum D/C]|uniref:type II toxin-antitoxin system PemK/MazF family toxin n=1 Tax=Clostridium botulinum TaxID=1491 RepID=UPI001E3C4460|nr:type II toxin-antitoxin system PemK/MazF family toxin [Clostridium botulinum]MCD3319497.1 type II toxin-antitoxin system PemK/MazF family toxin [Clostridium botulinum D/C]MCD3324362.1 type II toxin-antitoxin system PemK/MazF family toxin [Clostridium botulinum D/C]MCD3327363.1 type II toxin-antitoxin system PemK/MazF family toxin [Clostridium botulinum D/C]